ncbi:MAG: phenylalanine--tRNA ligase subunit beta [Verrucomicrobiota bacterium]|nr:phenylalanine--tRNA ligase subunit beta [Verrucomicrobiota bacterium]
MKITLNWLKQYVDFDWSPEELSERLTMLGVEVEGVQKFTGEFENVVVAEILSSDKHPAADKLSVCRVADGKGERQIVCGAKNYKVGDKVPLALPGCTLPTPPGAPPFTIKVSKMRGVESQGMMCSASELGLSAESEGLLILPATAKVGQPLAEHLGRAGGDVVYDLEVTPNRPDLNSVIGIAREIAALTGNPLRLPESRISSHSNELIGNYLQVRIEAPDLCPRYTARLVKGVTIGPSPDWLKHQLEKIGIRSINNVVDVTNYVLMEMGQPLHAFDYRLLERAGGPATVVVRRSKADETFVTLDGQKRSLTTDMLLIADERKGIALAGIMGGQNSEINPETTDVLIESAWFQPSNIRFTSKKLDLRTDSSYRFERGCDIEICDVASRRAAQLILELAGGQLLEQSIDSYPTPFAPKEVPLRFKKCDDLAGIAIPAVEQKKYLQQLGFKLIAETELQATFRIPSFRVDIKREVDLIEEVVRMHGINRIPATSPRGAIGSHVFDAVYDHITSIRHILTALGLNEAHGQTLISDISARLSREAAETVFLENPLSSDMNVLRPSLIPGLIDSLKHNLNHKNPHVALFEIGRVFLLLNSEAKEERRLAIAMTGNRSAAFWSGEDRDARLDIYDLKGVIEELLESLGIRGISITRREQPTTLYAESATIQLGKFPLGEMGQVLPPLARRYDLRDPVFVAELNLDQLLLRRSANRSFKALPSFPSIRRDIAMVVNEQTTHEKVLSTIKSLKPAFLEHVELFDVFRGRNVPEGQKSVAYAFTYRNPEKTLTDPEVNGVHDQLVQAFRTQLQATIRE